LECKYVKDLPVVYVMPGRRLVEIVIEVRERAGIIADVSEVISSNNINILYLLANSDGLKGRLIFFLDVTDSRISLSELKDIVKSKPYTISVDLWKPSVDGVIYDTLCFPTLVHGFKSFIIRYETFSSIIEEFRKRMGEGATVIFYHLGYYSGYTYAEYVKKLLEPLSLSLEEVVKVAFDLDRGFGDFNPEIVSLNIDRGEATIRVYDSYEVELIRGKMNKPSCQYVRGEIAGTLSSLMGRELIALEEKCIAKGDEYCEFHIKPRIHH